MWEMRSRLDLAALRRRWFQRWIPHNTRDQGGGGGSREGEWVEGEGRLIEGEGGIEGGEGSRGGKEKGSNR